MFRQSSPDHKATVTLVLIKPDAINEGLVGTCIHAFEEEGLAILDLRYHAHAPGGLLREHYAEHAGRDYYPGLLAHMDGKPLIAIAFYGVGSVATARRRAGPAVDPTTGTIRGDLPSRNPANRVHTSDSDESAQRELNIWFP